MPSRELSDWIAYLTVEPHGTSAFDLWFGQLYQLLIAANSKDKAPNVQDLMPIYAYQRSMLAGKKKLSDYERARAVMGGNIYNVS